MNPVLPNTYCCIAVENFIPDLYEPTSSVIRVRPWPTKTFLRTSELNAPKDVYEALFLLEPFSFLRRS